MKKFVILIVIGICIIVSGCGLGLTHIRTTVSVESPGIDGYRYTQVNYYEVTKDVNRKGIKDELQIFRFDPRIVDNSK